MLTLGRQPEGLDLGALQFCRDRFRPSRLRRERSNPGSLPADSAPPLDKLVSTGNTVANGGYWLWHDTSFSSGIGNSWGNALAVDKAGNFYIGGNTWSDDNFTECYAFIAKLDKNFKTVWYQRYWDSYDAVTYGTDYYNPPLGPNDATGIENVAFAPDGNLIAFGYDMDASPVECLHIRIMKVKATTGAVMWQTSRDKPYPWASSWDEGDGPVFDRAGNFYITYSIGNRPNYGAGPIVIAKFNSQGREQWSVVDDPLARRTNYQQLPTHEDVFALVLDGHDTGVYVASSYWAPPSWNMNFMVTKYNNAGRFQWRYTKDWGGVWDSPRGMAFGPTGYVYAHGNTSSGDWLCGMCVLTPSGKVVTEKTLNPTPGFGYAWNSAFDSYGRLVLPALVGDSWWPLKVAYYNTALQLVALNTYAPSEYAGGAGIPSRTICDKEGNSYLLVSYMNDSRYAGSRSILIAKGTNTRSPVVHRQAPVRVVPFSDATSGTHVGTASTK